MEGHLTSRGFSMVETVFSVSLIGIVVMLIFNLFPTSSMATHRARQELQASSLAQSLVEETRSQPFNTLAIGNQTLANVTVDGVVYTPRREIYRVTDIDPARLLGVRVTVRWTDRDIDHQLSQEAHFARFPR